MFIARTVSKKKGKGGKEYVSIKWWIMKSYRIKGQKYPKHEYLLDITDLSEVQRENLRKVLKNPKSAAIMEDELKERVEKYLNRAEKLFENLKIKNESINNEKVKKFYEMTMCYYNDAKYFYNKNMFIEALAALEYAEGWMDAGKLIGIFED